ncbi:MAG TPA: hypothetical protein VEB88_01815 [Candidatus Acidoferrales bacterium]|nr:hypothetical protein [Candidatus Acidoferrales bacterium]
MPLNIKEQGPIQREAGETLHAPISHHCYCDGKTDVDVGQADADTLVAKCRACNITFKFEGSLRSALHQMLPNVSLRAEAMFLAFSGQGISFFFRGEGGVAYRNEAEKIAQVLGAQFPAVATWRPRDVYCGIGQLEAILELLGITSQYNFVGDGKCAPAFAQSKMGDFFWQTSTARLAPWRI